MPGRSTWDAEARPAFKDARDPKALATALVRFHKRIDEVVDATLRGHSIEVAPHETFTLAQWLRKNFSAERLAGVTARLRDNAAKTRAMGDAARKRSNLACALLGDDGACTGYEARPAQCRRFHSTDLDVCKASFANPADDTIESPNHPAVAHNAAMIVSPH